MINHTTCAHKFTTEQFDGHYWCLRCDIAKDEANVIRRNPHYTGSNKSGICECGCSWEEHHLGLIVRLGNLLTSEYTYEPYVPQECEKYGHNERGGEKYNEETHEWESHCFGYKDKGK